MITKEILKQHFLYDRDGFLVWKNGSKRKAGWIRKKRD